GRVSNSRVAAERFDEMNRALVGSSEQRALNSAMLIAERDLEMEHALAMTLKPEVSGLNDARMHGADRDLVNFLAAHREKVRYTGRRRLRGRAVPIGSMKTNRLQPGMALRDDAPLLGDFALEPMRLRTLERKAWICAVHRGPNDRHAAGGGI